MWDSGDVESNRTLNVLYGSSSSSSSSSSRHGGGGHGQQHHRAWAASGGAGTGSAAGPVPLVSDTDYTWTVSWTDDEGAVSPAAEGSFSTALLKTKQGSSGGTLDWRGAEWISSPGNGSLNTYRTEFNVAGTPARARLYISGK